MTRVNAYALFKRNRILVKADTLAKMADPPSLAALVSRLSESGRMGEVRTPMHHVGTDSPPDNFSRVRASYFFADEEGYDEFLDELEHVKNPCVYFQGEIDDIPLSLRVPSGHFDPTHAVVMLMTSPTEYRVVRQRDGKFFKFFSSPSEGRREAVIHKFLARERPGSVVPFVAFEDSRRVFSLFPNMRFSSEELPVCIITEPPSEPYTSLDNIRDLSAAKTHVASLTNLICSLYFSYGFVHGDIHGQNVLATESGGVVLLDFGMSEVHGREISAKLNHHGATDVTYNFYSDEDVFLHIINNCSLYDKRIARHEYLHLYDLGRAIHKTVRGFSRELAAHFIPLHAEDPVLRTVKSSRFKNHFICAYKMVNAKHNNLASDRIRTMNDERRHWRRCR